MIPTQIPQVIFAFLLLGWGGAFALSLPETVERTLRTHPEQLISEANREAERERLAQARAGYFPEVNLHAGWGREYSENSTTRLSSDDGHLTLNRHESGISVAQTLFDGFETRNAVRQHRAEWHAAQRQTESMANTVSLRAAEVYVEVLRRRALLELAKDNLVAHQKMVDQIHTLATSGAGQTADLRQAESRLALATSNLLHAEGNLRDSETHFRRVVGADPDALAAIDRATLVQRLPKQIQEARETLVDHPTLIAAQRKATAAQAAFDRGGAAYWPTLKLELQAAANQNLDGIAGDNDEASAMLRMQYNLYRGGADQARRREAAQREQAARLRVESTRRELEEELNLAWNALQTLRKRLQHLTDHRKSSEKVVYAYRQQRKLGRRSLLDVLDSEREWHNARAALTSAQHSETFAMLRVIAATGGLPEALQGL